MATSTLQINDENDLYLADGRNLSILSGAAACIQDVRSKTRMRMGEDIYNVDNGVDYFGTIFTPTPDDSAARNSIIENIESSPDVISVEQLSISIDGNTFSYEAQYQTIYGLQSLKE